MISTELIEELRKLSHDEKIRVIQLLANDLTVEESTLVSGATYDIWSPYDSTSAAHTLLALLDSEQSQDE